MALKTTIVTALFDIDRENWDHYNSSYGTYLKWMKNTLSILTDMVIFTEEKFADYIEKERRVYDPNLDFTKIVITKVTQLESYKRFYGYMTALLDNEEFQRSVMYPTVPEMTKPLYNVLMYNKVFWLKEARDIIKSDVYVWLDAAAFREEGLNLVDWPHIEKLDKIQYFGFVDKIKIEDRKLHALGQWRFIQGGCFMVPDDKIDKLLTRFIHEVYRSFKHGYMSSDEKILDFIYSPADSYINVCDWREYYKFFTYECPCKKNKTVKRENLPIDSFTGDALEHEVSKSQQAKVIVDPNKDKTIFVQIASYRDPQLMVTIKDLLEKANFPNRIVLGVCRQYNPFEDSFDREEEKYLRSLGDQLRIINLNVFEETSPGVCWARNQIQTRLYGGEDYTLQLDSHMRFKEGWDSYFINQIKELQAKGYPKPLLTAYAPSYDAETNEKKDEVWVMHFDRFIPEGVVFMIPSVLMYKPTEPIPSRFYSAHMTFTLGQFCTEVPHDPEYYFHGEEISIAVRSYTWGYDLFHPADTYIWHEYHRNGRAKVWGDDNEWWVKNQECHLRNRKLLRIDNTPNDIDFGKCGFGSVRTIEDYEAYAGINFRTREVQEYTLNNSYPPEPNDSEWINHFKEYFSFNREYIREMKDDDLWILAVVSQDCTILHMEYYFRPELENILHESTTNSTIKGEYLPVTRAITGHLPKGNLAKKWIFRRHSPSKGWYGEDIIKDLPY
ncbi:MAG: hypothetical protein J5I47_11070 [Vicingus serpentipes]|nr:hypothetical protein [Vicingus serpentipes]